MSDDVRTCTCYKKIKSVAVIMSRKMYVLFEMEVVKKARKFVRCCQVRVSMNVKVTSSEGKGKFKKVLEFVKKGRDFRRWRMIEINPRTPRSTIKVRLLRIDFSEIHDFDNVRIDTKIESIASIMPEISKVI